MKFNLNNPAFLQAGGNKTMITRFVLTDDSRGSVQLSANGLVIVEFMLDGEKVRNTYSALSDTFVPIPVGIEATVYGAVTAINVDQVQNVFSSLDVSKNTALIDLRCNDCTGLTSLDVSKNTALTILECSSCTELTSLDVSKNTALIDLECSGCAELTSINGIAVNDKVSTAIATAITDATSVDGTVTLRNGDEFNQTIIDAAMDKGWDVQYYS